MKNYSEKRRDIARSALPSRRRKSSKYFLKKARRKNRRLASYSIRNIRSLEDYYDNEDDLNIWITRDTKNAVDDRRYGDNLGALEKWTNYHILNVPGLIDQTPDDIVIYFSSVFADNLVGRHALSHIFVYAQNLSTKSFPYYYHPFPKNPDTIELYSYKVNFLISYMGLSNFNKFVKSFYLPLFDYPVIQSYDKKHIDNFVKTTFRSNPQYVKGFIYRFNERHTNYLYDAKIKIQIEKLYEVLKSSS